MRPHMRSRSGAGAAVYIERCVVLVLVCVCVMNVYIMSRCSSGLDTPSASLPSGLLSTHALLLRAVEDALAGSSSAGEQLRVWLAAQQDAQSGGDLAALHTQQRCFVDVDESELCEYSGAGLCWDGEGVVAVAAVPVRKPLRVLDGTHACTDALRGEGSAPEWSSCNATLATARHYTATDAAGDAAAAQSLPLLRRRWGPLNRGAGLLFREVAPWEVFGAGQGAGRSRRHGAVDSLALASLPDVLEGASGAAGAGGGGAAPSARPAAPPFPSVHAQGPLRRLGSQNSHAFIAAAPDAAAAGLRVSGDDVLAAIDAPHGGAFEHPSVPGVRLRARYIVEAVAPSGAAARDAGAVLAETLRTDRAAFDRSAEALLSPPRARNVTVEWLDGALWLYDIGLPEERGSLLHSLSRSALLLQAWRNNATPTFGTNSMDGWVNWQADTDLAIARGIFPALPRVRGGGAGFPNTEAAALTPGERALPSGAATTRSRATFAVGAQWGPLPPQDVVMGVCGGAPCGDGARTMADVREALRSFVALSVQPHARTHLGDLGDRYSREHLLCARRAVVLGAKRGLFTARADATVFRNRAYVAADVKLAADGANGARQLLGSWPHYAPRAITVIASSSGSGGGGSGSGGAGIVNLDAVITLCQATGLAVRVVSAADVHALPLSERVQLMAGTGILVAAHSDALTNIVFMPAHAVLIELLPWRVKRDAYAALASMATLMYLAVQARSHGVHPGQDSALAGALFSRDYHALCLSRNVSYMDTSTAPPLCGRVAELLPVLVPVDAFSFALKNAIDATGAFSLKNDAWALIAAAQGIAPMSYEEWTAGRPQALLDAQGDLLSNTG